MGLNLKTDKGREIFLKLAKDADVIMEGFRPGVMKRLGVDYETVKKINPRIICCAITGYGQLLERTLIVNVRGGSLPWEKGEG